VLVACRRLDRGDDLARDAELGEVAEARLAVAAEVANRLVETDQPFLDEVIRVPAGEKVRRGLEPHKALVALHKPVVGRRVALLGQRDEESILNLRLSFKVT
jgi:hypothetical protein